MLRSRPTFGVIVDYMIAAYQVACLRAIEQATRARGANLLLFAGRAWRPPNPGMGTQNRIYDLLGPSNVDAVIVLAGPMIVHSGPAELAHYCRELQPLPMCSIGHELPGVPSLLVNNEQGTRSLVEHLIVRHGARRIAYIAGPEASTEATERYRGYLQALSQHGLTPDAALLTRGEFTVPTGERAIRELLSREVSFDAIVAANDYMAIAALEVLRERGVRIPNDVMIAGFDDAPFARFALPSLTTVRQPLEKLARTAVDYMWSAFEGREPPMRTQVDVEIVSRHSCGCGLIPTRRSHSEEPRQPPADVGVLLQRNRGALLDLLHDGIGIPPEGFGGWAERLLDGLQADFAGAEGKFLGELAQVLDEAQAHPDFVDELLKIVWLLRMEIDRWRPLRGAALDLEQTWHLAQLAVGNAATHAQGRQILDLEVVFETARHGFERVVTALDRPNLREAVAQSLRDVHIHRAAIGLFEQGHLEHLVPFLTVGPGRSNEPPLSSYPANQLVPPGFFADKRDCYVVMPLTFDQDWFGVFVMEYTTHETVFAMLRDNVSAALKSADLLRSALHQATLLERAERDRLRQEAMIAARIQTAILPRQNAVEGLSISARMLPAADVGGDYYDVIPFPGGCWIGIGDVSGHGLLAGLVMLMVQGMVASLVRSDPHGKPSHFVTALNAALYENVRGRLLLGDFVTFTLLKYEIVGTLTFAGAHEDLVVYRARTRRCETIETPGTWIGAVADVKGVTSDAQCALEHGDLLVLYSDGVTEAMNEQNEQFGLTRLCALVEELGARQVDEVTQGIVQAVEQWRVQQLDDVTVLAARYSATAVAERNDKNP